MKKRGVGATRKHVESIVGVHDHRELLVERVALRQHAVVVK